MENGTRKTILSAALICLLPGMACFGEAKAPAIPEVKIWLSSWNNETQKAEITQIGLHHAPYSMSEHGAPGNIRFISKEGEDLLPERILGSGLYTAAYFGCVTRGKPWFASAWYLNSNPKAEWSDHEASLALALIASAEGESVPEDVMIFGRMNPDRTLRNVDHIQERINAGLEKGIRKFVVPVSQTVIGEGNNRVKLASWVESQGAECQRVKMLSDLSVLFLKSSKEAKGSTENPDNNGEADAGLNRNYADLLRKTNLLLASPLSIPAWLNDYKGEIENYRAVAEEQHRLGVMAYQAGLTYPACEQLRKSEARLASLEVISKMTQAPEISLYEARADTLLKQIKTLTGIQPDSDMTSGKALYFLETGDELTGLKDWIEGTSNAVKKLKLAETAADKTEQTGALLRWVYSIESVNQEMKNLPKEGQTLFGSVEGANVFEAEWRVAGFLDLTSLAYADLTESFFYRIPARSDDATRQELLHNSAFVATLRNARENHIKNLTWYSGLPQDLVERREKNLVETQFVPGTGFAPQENIAFEAPQEKNDSGNKLITLLNQYSRSVETAYQMTTSSDAQTPSASPENKQQGDLLRLQEIAEEQARRSISNLKEMHINSNVPSIIFYRAFVLSQSNREEMKIEALRQFWRCTLISDALSVLSYTPAASVAGPADESSTEAVTPSAERAISGNP